MPKSQSQLDTDPVKVSHLSSTLICYHIIIIIISIFYISRSLLLMAVKLNIYC